jgi:hypothetical protein
MSLPNDPVVVRHFSQLFSEFKVLLIGGINSVDDYCGEISFTEMIPQCFQNTFSIYWSRFLSSFSSGVLPYSCKTRHVVLFRILPVLNCIRVVLNADNTHISFAMAFL